MTDETKKPDTNTPKETRLAPKARELLAAQIQALPVWVRAPKSGVEFYSGLSRAKLYELAAARKIVSRSIREAGQVRGCRLFLLSSILEFIANCDECRPQNALE